MKTISNKAGLLLTFLLILSLLMLTFAGCASYENFKDAFLEREMFQKKPSGSPSTSPYPGRTKNMGSWNGPELKSPIRCFPLPWVRK